MDKLKGVTIMINRKNKKKKALNHYIKKLSLKKISLIFYTIISIKSILMHNIVNLSDLLIELSVYLCIGIGLYISIKNVSIKQIREDFKLLFGND